MHIDDAQIKQLLDEFKSSTRMLRLDILLRLMMICRRKFGEEYRKAYASIISDADIEEVDMILAGFDMHEATKYPFSVIRQYAVGHGGFQTGALGTLRPSVRWIYDCGTWKSTGTKALKTEPVGFVWTVPGGK